MNQALAFRAAAPGDLPGLLALEAEAFGPDAFSPRQLRHLILHAKGAFFVALWQGALAGYISILTRGSKIGRIYSIAVAPAYQGKGIAGALIDLALAELATAGIKAVFLEVSPHNDKALALYAKKGFTRRGIKPNYYHDGGEAISMVKRSLPPK